mmetsp:Transcript_49719/g.80228  ORF Transcript_49719/g.80228 Transcript_49719/m.80228 type:complete len:266 (-) Transcript_49719:208-1005(-)
MEELQETDMKLLVIKTRTTRGLSLLGQTDCGKPSLAKSQENGMLDRCEEVRALQQAIETYKAGGQMSEALCGILAVFSQPVRPSATATTSATCGSRGPAARSSSMVPDGGRAHGNNSLEQDMHMALELREDLHDFGGKSDWLLAVTVRQHDGPDDEEGGRVEGVRVKVAHDNRMYHVEVGQEIKVTVRNSSTFSALFFKPVYVDEEAEEDEEDLAKPVQEFVCLKSFAMDTIVKSEIDSEDALVLKDAEGNLVLTLRFVLQFLQA